MDDNQAVREPKQAKRIGLVDLVAGFVWRWRLVVGRRRCSKNLNAIGFKDEKVVLFGQLIPNLSIDMHNFLNASPVRAGRSREFHQKATTLYHTIQYGTIPYHTLSPIDTTLVSSLYGTIVVVCLQGSR